MLLHRQSTNPQSAVRALGAVLAGLLSLAACGESPEKDDGSKAGQKTTSAERGPRTGAKSSSAGDKAATGAGQTRRRAAKPKLTPRTVEQAVLPRLVRVGAKEAGSNSAGSRSPGPDKAGSTKAGFDGGTKLLSLDPRLGLGTEAALDLLGEYRRASAAELARLATICKDIRKPYRNRLAKIAKEVDIRGIGEGKTVFYDVQLDRQGVESLVLLPEFWDSLEKLLGGPIWVALPDRRHMRIFRARIDSVLRHMASDFVTWSRDASEPLATSIILREGKRLVPGPSFEKLAKKGP